MYWCSVIYCEKSTNKGDEMSLSESRRKANAKYNAKTYKSFTVNMRIPEYEALDEYCRNVGISKNQLVLMSCKDWIERHPIGDDNSGVSE